MKLMFNLSSIKSKNASLNYMHQQIMRHKINHKGDNKIYF